MEIDALFSKYVTPMFRLQVKKLLIKEISILEAVISRKQRRLFDLDGEITEEVWLKVFDFLKDSFKLNMNELKSNLFNKRQKTR